MVFLSLCVNPLPAIMCSTIALLCQALFPHLYSFCSSRLSHYSKAVIKGARLKLYPPGFNLYRCSRGVKRPEVCQMTEQEAQTEVSGMPLTYEKIISITDEGGRCGTSSITVPIPNQRRTTTKHLSKPNKK